MRILLWLRSRLEEMDKTLGTETAAIAEEELTALMDDLETEGPAERSTWVTEAYGIKKSFRG